MQTLSPSFFSNWLLCYHLTFRGRNFTFVLCTVFKLMSNSSSLIVLSVGINNSTWHFVTLLSELVTSALCWSYWIEFACVYNVLVYVFAGKWRRKQGQAENPCEIPDGGWSGRPDSLCGQNQTSLFWNIFTFWSFMCLWTHLLPLDLSTLNSK